MPKIIKRSSSSGSVKEQRVPLHTLLARQEAYLQARRRRLNNRTPLKLRSTVQNEDEMETSGGESGGGSGEDRA